MSSAAYAFIGPRRAWEDEAVAATSEGVVIRLQHIYNFLLFHAIILPVLDVYGLYFTHLYYFWD